MKTIHLLRHAKSSWENQALADIDRPLNERGIRACKIMAPYLRAANSVFNNLHCSPAKRAQSTIKRIKSHLDGVEFTWKTDRRLYSFSQDELFEWCRALDESFSEVTIVGHNPALTDFCNTLSNSKITNIPTCGYVQMVAQSKGTWQDISTILFEMTAFLKPKPYKTK